jgi:hypothetical protein
MYAAGCAAGLLPQRQPWHPQQQQPRQYPVLQQPQPQQFLQPSTLDVLQQAACTGMAMEPCWPAQSAGACFSCFS